MKKLIDSVETSGTKADNENNIDKKIITETYVVIMPDIELDEEDYEIPVDEKKFSSKGNIKPP